MRRIAFCLLAGGLSLASFAAKSSIGFDLAKRDEYVASLKAKIADAKTRPLAKREYAYKLALAEMYVCEDRDYPKREAELMKLITERGDLSASDFVTFLYKTIRRATYGHPMYRQYMYVAPDVDAIGFKATADDPAARRYYYEMRLKTMADMANNNVLDESCSREARLRLIDGAEKDPAMAGRGATIVLWRLSALADLGRDADYVALADKARATTNLSQKVAVDLALAKFHRDRAKRYYDKPDAATLKKAEAAYREVVALMLPVKGRESALALSEARWGLAHCLYARGDYDGCRAMIGEMKANGYIDRGDSLRQGYTLLGDCYYEEERWQEAADAYKAAGNLRYQAKNIRYAGALLAIGRKDEALKIIESVAKSGYAIEKKRCQNAARRLKE